MQSTKYLSCVLEQPPGKAEQSLRKISKKSENPLLPVRICIQNLQLRLRIRSVGHQFKDAFGLDQRNKGTVGTSLFFERHSS